MRSILLTMAERSVVRNPADRRSVSRNFPSIDAFGAGHKEAVRFMKKTTLLAAVAIALTALSLTGAPEARADVGISIGIPLPGVTFYAPPPPVYYSAPAYYPRAYYAPPAYYGYGYGGYGPGYGSVYFGRSWGGHRYGGGHRWNGHRHGRHCRH